jgi:hypothetical protein
LFGCYLTQSCWRHGQLRVCKRLIPRSSCRRDRTLHSSSQLPRLWARLGIIVRQKPLINSVEVDIQKSAVNWRFNQGASRIEARRVAFVYESESPHLRLTWEWQTPAAFGPIEHHIHVANLSDRELWLALQDSLQFNWAVKPQVRLEQIYIERGANTPSEVGTHFAAVPVGYKWHGTSSTYAHPKADEPREIIPWFLLQESGGSKNGWYIGIEFSGRTQLSIERSSKSLKANAGLNSNPGPFRTRLEPGDSFDSPVVFLVQRKEGPIQQATYFGAGCVRCLEIR